MALPKPILVVDDHDDTRELVCTLLTASGYVVVEARNGQEALDLLVADDQDEPCLIVLDLEMPVMSGWELLVVLRSYARQSRIPVLVTSGSQKKAEVLACSGVTAYFSKPVDLDVLLRKVEEFAAEHCRPRLH